MAEKKSKAWPKVGTLRRSTDQKTGKPGASYIKLEPNVDIYVDGKKVEMNQTRTVRLEDPKTKVLQLHERGFIDEAEKDKRLERLEENSWLKYELVIAPPR